MQKLPIGIQTFREIRERGYLYVDKTQHIFRLIDSGKYFFVARPRRFGKSLTLSTIKEIYAGSRDLFDGLWIATHWNWEKIHPVIHIQFNEIGYVSDGLEAALQRALDKEAEKHGLELRSTSYDQKFRELLEKLCALKGKVVLLIDEYDKPLIDYLEGNELNTAIEHQKTLKNFYSIIKSADPNIEFFLITGVSKFSRISIFSDLNNLDDITIHRHHGTLMGYTQTELESYFGGWIESILPYFREMDKTALLKNIKDWYNGYSWNGNDYVYNPFSILQFFTHSNFADYWFKTGTPTFLVKKLAQARYFNLNQQKASAMTFESYSLENIDLTALLFQTGYLTIKEWNPLRNQFVLDYPNREVEQALSNHLIGALMQKNSTQIISPIQQLETAFLRNEPASVVTIINAMLKDVPSLLLANQDEHFYHALVHLHFRYLGFYIESEVHTSDGRMDAVVHTPDRIYLLEFKINKSADAALRQIIDKDYAARFRTHQKTISAIGINFDTTQHRISEWKQEDL
jgi:Predicted AAA-ATPase/PD-(D/E)XK nuclease superfamily